MTAVKDKKNSVLSQFSPHLFWDTDISKLDVRRDKTFIIERVMNYGLETDEIILYKLYTFGTITKTVTLLETLNRRTIAYLSMVLNIKETKFKCFGKTPSYLNC
jgi:hypothetical protein